MKTCIAPNCRNTSQNTNKIFIFINKQLAPKWCTSAGVQYNPKNEYFCCEDHLELKEALQNYNSWRSMGGKTRLNHKYIPNFVKGKENLSQGSHHESLSNLHHVQNQQEHENTSLELKRILLESNINMAQTQNVMKNQQPRISIKHEDSSSKRKPIILKRKNILSQACSSSCDNTTTFKKQKQHEILKMVPKGIQCKPSTSDVSTNYRSKTMDYSKTKGMICYQYSSDENLSSEIVNMEDYKPSTCGSTTEIEELSNQNVISLRDSMLNLIKKHPKLYVGVPESFFWIVNYIAVEYKIDVLNIILTLYKIKQNDTFIKMSHIFQISRLKLSSLFPLTIIVLANFFNNLIFFPDSKVIKKNLPLVFKIRFSNVQCILDCFEIEIEKPSNPQSQSQTWSQYKNCNTAKYLVGCTPDGFINFISKGYGGRTSDRAIVEQSHLLDILPPNAVIMADRGFKAVEPILAAKNIKLLRPPSVYTGTKPSKEEVAKTKVIASLRVHVERLIRRLREFNILKPHSVVKHQHLCHLDEIVIIACGLCNLQSKIIKDN